MTLTLLAVPSGERALSARSVLPMLRSMELSGFSHVALTVRDMKVSREFYSQALGLTVLASSESFCALLIGATGLAALILTTHEQTAHEPFSEFRPGLDHVSLAVPDLRDLDAWRTRLTGQGVRCDVRRSEWGHHLNFRDPDNIAVELVVVEPDADVQNALNQAGLGRTASHAASRPGRRWSPSATVRAVARILVTGMSGAGKTTLLNELRVRGHLTVDTDYDGWVLAGGLWDEPRMARLLADHDEVVVAGTVENQGVFRDRFDHVVLLTAPLDVLLRRVAQRSNNPYGGTPEQREDIRRHVREVEPLLRRGASIEVDGRQPVHVLADIVERLLRRSRCDSEP